jgi:hypothetical protein
VSGDFSAGHHEWSTPVLALAGAGFLLLALRRRRSALLTLCVVAIPALAFLVAKLHSTASPEARHLIFGLPFYSTLLAAPLVQLGRVRPPLGAIAAAAACVVLLVGEVSWAHRKTPPLFDGTPRTEASARAQAAAWLVARSRPDDVLFGYEPLYLAAWQRDRQLSTDAIPRADATLLADALQRIRRPLGHGVWVLDASDTTNVWRRSTIAYALPQPPGDFVARAFGPYLVIRSRRPLRTPANYLVASARVMMLGRRLRIGDAGVNLGAIRGASASF